MGAWLQITPQPGPSGRSAGSVTWFGVCNTYYWLDPQKRIAGVFMTEILPFAGDFESGIRGGLKVANRKCVRRHGL
jgi:CubicO group peptidase (beta-lactamase class C family)